MPKFNSKGLRACAIGLSVFCGLAVPPSSRAASAELVQIPVFVQQIENFRVGSTRKVFGAFEFIGGLELTSSSRALGAISSIRLSQDRSGFLGVMDTGHWFSGRIVRDEKGRPVNVTEFSIAPMRDRKGSEDPSKWQIDSEGMTIRGNEILVSFERDHRIDIYPAGNTASSKPSGSIPVLIPEHEFRGNRGLETIAVSPETTGLHGATVTVSERSLNEAGDMFAAILDGPERGVFYVKRHAPFDITDGDFLPDGDLLLLERRFSIAGGIGMRIRRIEGSDIRPGETADGEVLLEADFGYQIDNMEGLDVSTGADGNVYVILVSDDNHSILQRNLLLEFRLRNEARGNGALGVPTE